MKKIFGIFAAIALCGGVNVASAHNITEGHWEVGGGFNFNTSSDVSRYTDATKKTSLYAAATGQYFFKDHYAAGLFGSFATEGVRPIYSSIGPIATKYFMIQDAKWAPFVNAIPIMWVNANDTGADAPADWASSLSVGAKYFFTPAVAFGPAVNYTYFWGRDANPSASRFSLVGTFSVHL